MSSTEKAIRYLIGHCRVGQRTRDLQEKLAFVQLEIDLTKRLEEVQGTETCFARRERTKPVAPDSNSFSPQPAMVADEQQQSKP